MTQTVDTTGMKIRMPAEPGEAVAQLSAMMSAYNEAAGRLQQSHAQLQNEVRRLREELKSKNEQLERKSRLAALGEMAAGMAHEIRNPLGAVQLYASMLEKELAGQPHNQDWARKIVRAVGSLDRIVNDMLAYTQDQACARMEVSFWGVLTETLDLIRPRLGDEAVVIDTAAVDRRLMVNADLSMLGRVLLNLLLNAVEALEGAGRIEVSAAAVAEGPHRVCIRIADNGPGIPAEAMPKLFDPFFTTRDTGTGLGLAIVHRLVDCHNGIVVAANRPKGGAEFAVWLP